MRRHAALYGMALLLVAGGARAAWLKEIEIALDPEEDGQRICTVRFTPGKTFNYDEIDFECVYHQEFPWETPRGKKYTKIHEPVNFLYRHSKPRLVNDLDFYGNFRIPISLKRLMEIHGPRVFNKDYPIVISRIVISGRENTNVLWSVTLPPDGKHGVAAATPEPAPEEPKQEGNDKDKASPAPPAGGQRSR